MPKANKGGKGHKGKVYALPSAQKKRGLDVPKFQKAKTVLQAKPTPSSIAALSAASQDMSISSTDLGGITFHDVIDTSLTRDSSSKAFMRELRKVVERSDVIIQVLDARDPEGTRSRWVEEEVRKRDIQGKKLLGVLNKIDLVPRANLEAWLKHLRHSFPTMPFKSSTQNQRQNLSQNAVPLAQPAAVPGKQSVFDELPTTSSSLGAPALIHLLKQYALSTPHNALTVGVVGYPNVGKSSLINSLKRSRACAVAAMPGKTRVVQEVTLDKGVKILDCPGVVLEDIGSSMEGEEGRRRQAEIMLRNCIKAELVQDPVAPVEVILSKVDPAQLQKIYNLPLYDDTRDFLIKLALTRGRLGKGGIPDLEGAAVQVLRDWNSGKIAYYTVPPKFHPSSAPAPVPAAILIQDEGMSDATPAHQVGDAKILTTLTEAFTIDGLFDHIGDDAAWAGEDNQEMAEDVDLVASERTAPVAAPIVAEKPPQTAFTKRPFMDADSESDDDSDAESDDLHPRILPPISTFQPKLSAAASSLQYPSQPTTAQANRLFSAEEIAVLGPGMFDKKKQKKQAKKVKKQRAAVERTEGELLGGFMGMEMDEREKEEVEMPVSTLKSKKDKRKEKKQAAVQQRKEEKKQGEEMDLDDDAKNEAAFANFLSNMGADESDEDL